MHTPFAGGEVVRERPFLFLVFLRRASEGLFHVTRGGAEFRAVIEVVDEPVLIAKLIVLSHGGKPFEGQIILVIELSPKALALIGELTHLDGYAPVMVGTGKVKRAVLVPDLLNLAVDENVALTETGTTCSVETTFTAFAVAGERRTVSNCTSIILSLSRVVANR